MNWIYTELNIDPEGYTEELKVAAGKAISFARNIVYYCKETIGYFLAKGIMEGEALEKLQIEEEGKSEEKPADSKENVEDVSTDEEKNENKESISSESKVSESDESKSDDTQTEESSEDKMEDNEESKVVEDTNTEEENKGKNMREEKKDE